MRLYSESVERWFEDNPDRRDSFNEKFIHLNKLMSRYTSFVGKAVHDNIGFDIKPGYSRDLLNEVVIDTVSDLERISKFHDTPAPNRLKEAAYTVYWIVRHKPIALERKLPIPSNAGLDELTQFRLRFINEEFGVRFIMGAVYPYNKQIAAHGEDWLKESLHRRKIFEEFLLYYLVYRLESAKSLEAIMLAMTISPAWEIDSGIWKSIE
ncbi:MAG: hypothetical protein J6O04_03775 [Selenomonadaceae bacterium]|nr:hypothetical protein [Selenomonadaceae bacterium]